MRFELTPPKRTELESVALDRSAMKAYIYIYLDAVGFEPTLPKELRPERSALDHSAKHPVNIIYIYVLVSIVGQYSRLSLGRPGFKSRTRKNIYIKAFIAQLGERQTEDLKAPGSIPGEGKMLLIYILIYKGKMRFELMTAGSAIPRSATELLTP